MVFHCATAIYILQFILGFGIAISTTAAPTWVTELAPPQWRGRIGALYNSCVPLVLQIAYSKYNIFASPSQLLFHRKYSRHRRDGWNGKDELDLGLETSFDAANHPSGTSSFTSQLDQIKQFVRSSSWPLYGFSLNLQDGYGAFPFTQNLCSHVRSQLIQKGKYEQARAVLIEYHSDNGKTNPIIEVSRIRCLSPKLPDKWAFLLATAKRVSRFY